MSRSREDNERLDRLASEVKKGGGLALPSFFSAILEELLDNGPTPNDRLAKIVAEVGANKTMKLAETWDGSWEFLTADLMNQLVCQGYAVHSDDDQWELGGNFEAGVRLETIPARKGLNRASGTTVWPKDQRQALNRVSVLETQMEAIVRQPRGKVHSHKDVTEMRASYETWGPLHAITVDAHGRTLDGRHRRDIDRNWPVFVRDDITTDEQAVDVILEMAYWAERNLDKLSPTTVEKIKGIRGEWGEMPTQSDIKRAAVRAELLRDAARSNRTIADLSGVAPNTVISEREALVQNEQVHRYEFTTASRGKHSAACWCGEGDAKPKPVKEPKQDPPRAGTYKDPVLQEFATTIWDRLGERPTGPVIAKEAEKAGVKVTYRGQDKAPAQNTWLRVLDEVEKNRKPEPTVEPVLTEAELQKLIEIDKRIDAADAQLAGNEPGPRCTCACAVHCPQ